MRCNMMCAIVMLSWATMAKAW